MEMSARDMRAVCCDDFFASRRFSHFAHRAPKPWSHRPIPLRQPALGHDGQSAEYKIIMRSSVFPMAQFHLLLSRCAEKKRERKERLSSAAPNQIIYWCAVNCWSGATRDVRDAREIILVGKVYKRAGILVFCTYSRTRLFPRAHIGKELELHHLWELFLRWVEEMITARDYSIPSCKLIPREGKKRSIGKSGTILQETRCDFFP
jgi:hypothetical protein